MPDQHYKDFEASPVWAGLRCRCPRCGKGKLYRAYLKVAPECSVCGLDFRAAENADGPAVIVTLILGFPVAFAMVLVEVAYTPPIWVHMALWIPMIVIGTLLSLPPLKGVFIAQQLRYDAREAQLDATPDTAPDNGQQKTEEDT